MGQNESRSAVYSPGKRANLSSPFNRGCKEVDLTIPEVVRSKTERPKRNIREQKLKMPPPKNLSDQGHVVTQAIEADILDRKIRRLVCKLKKHGIDLKVFDHADIEYGPVLGKGGEGVVRQCTVKYLGLPVDAAVKTMLHNSDDALSITMDEIELLCLASDPISRPVLRVFGVAAVPNEQDPSLAHLAIITEAGISNLLQLYQEEEMTLGMTLELWAQLAAAVQCIHSKNIIHQDLKPENVLVTDMLRARSGKLKKVTLKVIDMGMAKRVYTDKVVTEDILGTVGYHAPEVLTEDSYDFRADIFMLGMTFCVLLQSAKSLEKVQVQAWLNKIHNAKKTWKKLGRELFEKFIEPSVSEKIELPNNVKNMLCKMLERQEKRNISLLEIVEICRAEARKLAANDAEDSPVFGGSVYQCQDSGVQSSESKVLPARHSRAQGTRAHDDSDNEDGDDDDDDESEASEIDSSESEEEESDWDLRSEDIQESEPATPYTPRRTRSMADNPAFPVHRLRGARPKSLSHIRRTHSSKVQSTGSPTVRRTRSMAQDLAENIQPTTSGSAQSPQCQKKSRSKLNSSPRVLVQRNYKRSPSRASSVSSSVFEEDISGPVTRTRKMLSKPVKRSYSTSTLLEETGHRLRKRLRRS